MAENPDLLRAQLIANETFTSRAQLARQIGNQPAKNIDLECGYPTSLTVADYKLMYVREGIARRVVNVFPRESWRKPPEITETKNARHTKFEKSWKRLEKRLKIWSILERADILSGIGTFGVILLGLNDGKSLDMPVDGMTFDAIGNPQTTAKTDLIYLRPFDESSVQIASYEQDKNSYRYGMPTAYNIGFNDVSSGSSSSAPTIQTTVHWHRIIHLADNRGDSEVFGSPRMEGNYNRLYDLRKILSASGEMFWKGGFPGLAVEISPGVLNAPEFTAAAKEALKQEIKDYFDGLQRGLTTVGLTAKTLSVALASPMPFLEAEIKALGIGMDVPYRVFMGSEEAKLASEQDTQAWVERLKHRQESYLTPYLVRPLVNRLLSLGCLEPLRDAEEGFDVEWADLHTKSDSEKANVSEIRANAIKTFSEIQGNRLMSPKDFLVYVLDYDEETAQVLIDAAGKELPEKITVPAAAVPEGAGKSEKPESAAKPAKKE